MGWSSYENDHFEIYSDGPEEDIRMLAQDLERFRAALQAFDGRVQPPAGGEKTRILIFRSREEFATVFRHDIISAFTTGVNGRPYIVMAADEYSAWASATIRHEFIHVLQGYDGQDLPSWYFEGYAEFMSGMSIDVEENSFTLGKLVQRAWSRRLLVPWDELLSSDFRFENTGSAKGASTAYFQAGLLVRYLTIGDDHAYRDRLARYLAAVARGDPSAEAFERVFGESIDEFGSMVYKRRRRAPVTATYEISSGPPDGNFRMIDRDASTIRGIVAELEPARH